MLGDPVPGDRVDRVDGPENRTAERYVSEHLLRKRLVHEVRRIVLVHRDLFEDHAALGVNLLGLEERARHHVRQDIDRQRQILVKHPRVVARVLLGGERVQLAADRV